MRILKIGTVGPDVVELQKKLAERGFPPGPADGSFGPGTQAAVLAFQRSEDMLPDGIVGPKTAAALGFEAPPKLVSSIPSVTVAVVSQMFPLTLVANIERHLPNVLDGLVGQQLPDKGIVLVALATIRAETESFRPISEGQSKFNTSPGGQPFDLYDNRKDLGNLGSPDGGRFKGRGFVQLTGRANYSEHGRAIGLGSQLLDNPDLANDSVTAARLLASFLKSKEQRIRQALLDEDLRAARRLVNGGSNGLDRFVDAYHIGNSLIPEEPAALAGEVR